MLIIGLIGNNQSEKNYVVQNIIVPVLRHYTPHFNIQILNISDIKKYKLEQVSQTKQIGRITSLNIGYISIRYGVNSLTTETATY
jgi:hypothetical protein